MPCGLVIQGRFALVLGSLLRFECMLFWWEWAGAGLICAGFLLGLLLARKRRAGYCATLSAMVLAILGFFWIADWNASGTIQLSIGRWMRGAGDTEVLQATWSRGEVSALLFNYKSTELVPQRDGFRSGLSWWDEQARDLAKPGFGESWWWMAGFRETVWVDRVEFVAPMWFAVAVILVPVGWWFYKARWGIRRARRRVGLCENCGYSRRGIDPMVRCPECGSFPGADRVRLTKSGYCGGGAGWRCCF